MRSHPVVIWNPSAGTAGSVTSVLCELRANAAVDLVQTRTRMEADRVVRSAVADGCRRVIAAGGDGTVNAVLQTLVDLNRDDVSLAVLPLGTGNDLARTLGMPLDVTAAIPICLQPATRHLDVFVCRSGARSRVIANMCTCGNSGVYLQNLTTEVKRRWGPFCYLRGVVDVLVDLRTFDLQIACDDEPAELYKVLNLFVANGPTTGGGMTVADPAVLDDRRLEVVIVLDGPVHGIASLTADYLLGDFLQHPMVIHRSVRRLRVKADGPFPVTIDGDVFTDGPFQVECTERQIAVVANVGSH